MLPPRITLAPRQRRTLRTAAAFGGTAAAMLFGATGAQAAGCTATPVATVFAGLGDLANYTLAPGGSFENGTPGWSLTGASVVAGNETTTVAKRSDGRSLSIAAKGGLAVSAPFCVGIEHPSFRFTARETTGTWAVLIVGVRYTDSSGHVNTVTVAALNGGDYTKWTATPSLKLATALPLWNAGQSVSAQIVLDPNDSGGDWQIDDLYVDPYRRS